ncbi:hypothetical protein [Deinococcus sp.]|uniref:hypothetical protein n=1 Tax=Deinococcus sp. TaxID=47478 RepID=UPI0028699865|nr:hypothetical protein [Deinococcus sp.]
MRVIKGFFSFWYDFIVGDDWTVAVAVIAALLVTSLLAHLAGAWVVLPLAVLVFVGVSLWKASRP